VPTEDTAPVQDTALERTRPQDLLSPDESAAAAVAGTQVDDAATTDRSPDFGGPVSYAAPSKANPVAFPTSDSAPIAFPTSTPDETASQKANRDPNVTPFTRTPTCTAFASLPGTITHGMFTSAATRQYVETVIAKGHSGSLVQVSSMSLSDYQLQTHLCPQLRHQFCRNGSQADASTSDRTGTAGRPAQHADQGHQMARDTPG
jgi:hypothetical protein